MNNDNFFIPSATTDSSSLVLFFADICRRQYQRVWNRIVMNNRFAFVDSSIVFENFEKVSFLVYLFNNKLNLIIFSFVLKFFTLFTLVKSINFYFTWLTLDYIMLQEADSSTSSSSSPGLKWSNELLKLRSCGSSYELSLCLRQIIIVLNSINRQDRIKFCQSDFNVSISTLKVNPLLWNENIKVLILDINSTYFNKVSSFTMINVSYKIFKYLNLFI